jgi:cell division protein FtsN
MSRAPASPTPRAHPARGRAQRARRSNVGGTLLGLFVGIVLGLVLAAGAAYYVMRAGNPYQASVAGAAREAAKSAGARTGGEAAGSEKPRFDFYKILPGVEEPKVQGRAPEQAAPERAPPERAAVPDKGIAKLDEVPAAAPQKAPEAAAARAPKPAERIWLQAGSFSSEGDAENLRAQLALSGIEASLQRAILPDKSVRFRVRLGPYDNVDEVTRAKSDLAKRGFDASVIK